VGSYVGLRGLHMFAGACDLTFVTLSESFVHNSRLHLR
jgi:hypothetical protein